MGKRINWGLWAVLVAGLVLRLALVNKAINPDLITQADWGEWIYKNGWFGFYENDIWVWAWPNHPPLINLIYGLGFKIFEWLNTIFTTVGSFIALNHLGASKIRWFYDFVVWFAGKEYGITGFNWGELISLKLTPILADVGLGWMIYKIGRQKASHRLALAVTALYLFSPFSWYESALWGQSDQIAVLFLIMAFWLLSSNRWEWLASIVLVISVGLKPTTFIFWPLFLWVALKDKKKFIRTAIGGAAAVVIYLVFAYFTSSFDVITFSLRLQKQIFVKGELWTWINSFNFWRLTTGYITDYRNTLLGINYKIWGYVLYGLVNIYVFYKFKKRDWESNLKSMFILGFSGWLFMVTMHERYLYAGIVMGLIVASRQPALIKYWIPWSLLFAVNMYYGWWTPEIKWLTSVLTWGVPTDSLVAKGLAAANLIIFWKATAMLTAEKRIKYGK